MSVLALPVGLMAIGGYLLAWRLRGLAPLFLLLGGGLTALTFVGLLLRSPTRAAFVALLALPYWVSWVFVYTLLGISPRAADGS